MIQEAKPPSRTSLVSIFVFYITFSVLLSIFFWFLVHDIASGSNSRFKQEEFSQIFILFSFIIIIIAVIVILWVVYKLLRLKKIDTLQGGLKLRLMGFFTGFAFLITMPQVVLSIMIVFTTTEEWLPTNTENVVVQSRKSLIANREKKLENLAQFSKSRILVKQINAMMEYPSASNRLWNELQQLNNFISSVQIFSPEGDELIFGGDKAGKIEFSNSIKKMEIGQLPLSINQNSLIFRYLLSINLNNEDTAKVIISMVQPRSDNRLISDLTNLSNHYKPLIESRAWIGKNISILLLLFIILLNLLSIYISLYLSNLIIRPILEIEKATQRVANGDFHARLYPDKSNNFTLLANSFNKMVFDLGRLQKDSSHNHKMQAWQDIAKRMAHEINNPLTPIRLSAERMQRQYNKAPDKFAPILEKSTKAIISEVENLDALLKDFRAFSKLPEPFFTKVNLFQLIEESVIIYSQIKGSSTRINTNGIERNIEIFVDKNQIKQVISNLIKNSIEAIQKSGKININSTLVSKQNIKYCRITIEDNGIGMSEDVIENIFTPYYTTKKEGTGLGLSIIERIIFVHKGKIRVTSKEAKGTTFIIDLPTER